MNIKIENAWGEHGDWMTLYRNNEKIKDAEINGANEPPDTLLDFLREFDITPSTLLGGLDLSEVLDSLPKFDNNGTLVWIIIK